MILLTGTQYDTSLHVVLLETGYEISDELNCSSGSTFTAAPGGRLF